MLIVLGIAYVVVFVCGWYLVVSLRPTYFDVCLWWFYLYLLVVCLFGCSCLMEWVACGLFVVDIGCGAVVVVVTPLCSITWFCCLF